MTNKSPTPAARTPEGSATAGEVQSVVATAGPIEMRIPDLPPLYVLQYYDDFAKMWSIDSFDSMEQLRKTIPTGRCFWRIITIPGTAAAPGEGEGEEASNDVIDAIVKEAAVSKTLSGLSARLEHAARQAFRYGASLATARLAAAEANCDAYKRHLAAMIHRPDDTNAAAVTEEELRTRNLWPEPTDAA